MIAERGKSAPTVMRTQIKAFLLHLHENMWGVFLFYLRISDRAAEEM